VLTFSEAACNRLDRLTSGIMFMAKTRHAADEFTSQLSTRTVRKQYVARVKGEFPAYAPPLHPPPSPARHTSGLTTAMQYSSETTCDQPILSVSPKLGLNRVRASGKPAKTLFKRLRYVAAGGYSIVECHPFTGRTHQIRVHLQFLGHPIVNDPVGSSLVATRGVVKWLILGGGWRRYTVTGTSGGPR
jgi:tRNA pseudouridine synthase 9